ncbi:F-box/kelch-repeat protein-like protein, partial [Tanacetum coccineum]
ECDSYVGFGFGYNESSDEYKVVGIPALMNHETEAEVKIYSLRSGYWKRLGDFTCGILKSQCGILLNGTIH